MRIRPPFTIISLTALLVLGASPETSPPAFRMVPKARQMSLFEFNGRVEIMNVDVSFGAPPEYHETFSFWTNRMKKVGKKELVRFLTTTREVDGDGAISFRKQVSRYDLEISRAGKLPATVPRSLIRAVQSVAWEGMLDSHGGIKEMRQVAGEENKDLVNLVYPILHDLFPRLDGPRDLRIGEQFTVLTEADLPSRIPMEGFEDIGMIMTRHYTLEKLLPEEAVFSVSMTYAEDPKRSPSRERSRCVISGKGSGEAVFDIKRGFFRSSRLRTRLTIDIEAPLRKLPEHEDDDPGLGTTRIVQNLTMQGKQVVSRLFGKDED